MVVMTTGGQTLVESQASQLGYSAAAAMTPDHRYVPPGSAGYPGTIGGIILNPTGSDDPSTLAARDLTQSLGEGRLSALVEMRDRTLADFGNQFEIGRAHV